jgi:predicted KAP-like P-loop ATPase
MSESQPSSCFQTDQAITHIKQDELGRANFAISIAGQLSQWKNSNSLVIGIYGEWGSGKTSIKNLIVENLNAAVRKPHIIEFNPWQWASQDQVAEAFFREIGVFLDCNLTDDETTVTWHHLSDLVLEIGSTMLASQEIFLPQSDSNFFGRACLKLSSILWKAAADRKANKKAPKKSMGDIKEHLRKLFEKIDLPILVFIDDIDRLSNSEIELLMQVIKVNADFPNMVYVLLCDRKRVEEALGNSGHGPEFLEKIVQVNFHLPEVERSRLEKILLNSIEEIFKDAKIADAADRARWIRLFNTGLRPYFRNLREIKRFVSSLKFYAGLFRNGATYEVDIYDLIALQVLREFEPELYGAMGATKNTLTGVPDPMDTLPGSDDGRSAVLESLLKCARRREQAQRILDLMFPAFEPVLKGLNLNGQAHMCPVPRIGNPQSFDRYFYFRTAQGDVSEVEVYTFLHSPRHLRAGAEILRNLNKDGRVDALLRRLRDPGARIAVDVEPIINSFFDVGDEFAKKRTSNSYFSVFHDAVYVSQQLVMDRASQLDVFGLLINGLSSGASLGFSASLLKEIFDSKFSEKPVLSPDEIKNLKISWGRKIRDAVKGGKLVSNIHLADILETWSEWENEIEPKRWLENQIEGSAVLDVVQAFTVTDSLIEGKETVNSVLRVEMKRLAKFVNPHSIVNYANNIARTKELNKEEVCLLEALNRSYNSYIYQDAQPVP